MEKDLIRLNGRNGNHLVVFAAHHNAVARKRNQQLEQLAREQFKVLKLKAMRGL